MSLGVTTGRSSGAWASLIVLLGVLGVAGCGSGESPPDEQSDGPSAQALAFLRAQADGRFADALDLSTASAGDFVCEWMMSNGRGGGVAAPEVGQTATDPDNGTVRVDARYSIGGDITTTLSLSGGDDAWKVHLPESYVLEAAFTGPAVAIMRLDDAPEGAEACAVDAQDGAMSMAAFLGSYVVTVEDPTGVMDYGSLGWNALVTGTPRDAVDLGEPVPEWQLAELRTEVFTAGQEGRLWCGAGPCSLSEDMLDDDGALLPVSLERVWTDDGTAWLAEFDVAGRILTGTVERSTEGDLDVRLDAGA